MTDCEKILEMLSAYYDEELSESDASLVRGHLDTCESCTALLRLFGDVSDAYHDAEPPAELRERVMKRVSETEPLRAVKTTRIALRRIVPAAACISVMLLALPLMKNIGCSGSSPNDKASMSGGASPAASMMPVEVSSGAGTTGGESYEYGGVIEEFDVYNAPENDSETNDDGGGTGAAPKKVDGEARDVQIAAEPAEAPPPSPSTSPGTSTPAETSAPIESMTAPQLPAGEREDFSVYYAVIKLPGEAPPILDAYTRLDKGDGMVCVYIPREVADVLIGEEYDYVLYNEDAAEAVVILPPGN